MKASIITMTSTYNYGATMQAYALQEFVKKLGHEANLIDHMSSPNPKRTISLSDFSKINLMKMPYKFSLEKGYRSFEEFYDKHMQMSRRYPNMEELKACPPDSDVFIAGSDQVWNYKDAKLSRFLLDFAPDAAKKISYAASMGNSELPEEKKEIYREALRRFDAVSVREEEARGLIAPLTDKEVQVNCDPAFLLDAEEWRALEKPVKGIQKDTYILCYMIHMPTWFNDWIQKISKKLSLKIVYVGLNGYRSQKCDKYVRTAGPGEFLWLIDNAAMVVSSSFHGNVFSLIFGKKLISTPDAKRPDRIHNLLRMFGENEREIYSPDAPIPTEAVDAESVRKVAKEQQEKSKAYLESVFNTVGEKEE